MVDRSARLSATGVKQRGNSLSLSLVARPPPLRRPTPTPRKFVLPCVYARAGSCTHARPSALIAARDVGVHYDRDLTGRIRIEKLEKVREPRIAAARSVILPMNERR